MIAIAKEKEPKKKTAPFYGKLTPDMRLYQTLTEKNLADGVFPYILNQSMIMSEDKLTRTLVQMSLTQSEHSHVRSVGIMVDCSTWCTSVKSELASPLFKEIDNLFGLLNIFAYSHRFPIVRSSFPR